MASAEGQHEWLLVVSGAIALTTGFGLWALDRLRRQHADEEQPSDEQQRSDEHHPETPDTFRGIARVGSMDDFDEAVAAGHLVLVGDGERLKWLRFACPCGCRETIALNLMASHSPRWSVEQHSDGTLSVSPSVDATTCGSHFWIRAGKVAWVGATRPTQHRGSSS